MMSVEACIVCVFLFGFMHDSIAKGEGDQSFDDGMFRNPAPMCRFLCTPKMNNPLGKETALDLCSRECPRSKKKGGSYSSALLKERLRRASDRKEEEDCLKPSDVLQGYGSEQPEQVIVDFETMKPNLSVKWSPASHQFHDNWTYVLMYHDYLKQNDRCFLIPKDQNKWIIRDGEDWDYPNRIFLGVATYPYHKLEMFPYSPIPPAPTIPPTVPHPTNKVIVAIIGVAAGVVLLLLLVLVYRKRFRGFPCFSKGNHRSGVDNPMINNSCVDNEPREPLYPPVIFNDLKQTDIIYACYYPENEKFTDDVARIVNYFRHNGYQVVMDVMSINEMVNLGPTRWAEQQIKKARKILVFLSPGLLRLCGAADEESEVSLQENERVWYELSLVRTIYSQTHSAAKMVCITLPQSTTIDQRDLPLWAEMRYRWPEDTTKILHRLNDRPFILPL